MKMSTPRMYPSDSISNRLESALIRRVIYPLWTRRDHPTYLRYARSFAASQYFSADELHELQTRLLRKQLLHAYCNVPFYRRRMEKLSITPVDIQSLDDLRHLPCLTKKDIQDHKEEMLADDVPLQEREQNQTGGSTGSPLQFWVDKERFDSRRASTDRHNAWAGFRPGDWLAVLWGSTFDIGSEALSKVTFRERFLERTLTLNTSLVSRKDFDAFVALLRKYRPRFLKAYAQAADMFARHCNENGITDIHFDGIITSAEVLLPEARVRIEQTFSGRVFNRYGCREVSVIASECEHHTGMHVNADALLVEIEPIAGAPENYGRVLVTDLYNRSMPLIRYEIGDIASWETGAACPCGRSLPRLANVAGRITDFLVMPDGSMVSGPSLALLIGQTPEVRQAQFVQSAAAEIELRVVPHVGYGEDTVAGLKRRLQPYLRDQVRLRIVPVEKIDSEPSGKYRFIKREFQSAVAADSLPVANSTQS
jgi:phenylacetate-CoA ligase